MSLTREFLKDLGVEGDSLEKIMAEVGKEHTNDAKVAELQSQVDSLKSSNEDLTSQVSARDDQLDELSKQAGNSKELSTKIDELKQANQESNAIYEAKIATINKNNKIDLALRDAGARNPKAVRALLDESKVSVDGDNIIGLADQLKSLEDSDSYLFQSKDDKPNQGIHATAGGNPSGAPYTGKKSLAEMSLSEQTELYKSDPEEFARLSGQK
ncbi:phage scaffolding protein [Pediococcus pentosaceus]|uniref:phage scaffolding protein n=1 Tax=Pediococcus pentosaceus TaxID=1255 RepID=UPI002AB503F2|nr:phage scaffolding protein [Pediococcus pentosaceus]MDY8105901.1 phage scaffolding protein [Pediococcus pentosaceus]